MTAWAPRHIAGRSAGLLTALFLAFVFVRPAAAQTYSVDLRNVELDQALRVFAERTGTAVAYDPERVRGLRVSCGVATSDVEVYLACLLSGTGLEYFRRASGTYVIGPALALPANYGLVTGQVEDAGTGIPLELAHVAITPAARGAVTGRGGRFVLADLLPGRYALSVSHLGYAVWRDSVDVVPGSATRLRVGLEPRAVLANPVVVVDSPSPPTVQEIRASTGSVRVRLPGTVTDLTGGLQIHGSALGDLQLRLDGHPVYLPRQLLGVFGPFTDQSVDRIRVSQSGFGAADGSVLGGVLDFTQASGEASGFTVSANSYASEGALTLAQTPAAGRTRLRASARTSHLGRTRPAAVLGTLERWSTTDPYLLFAPAGVPRQANEETVARLYRFTDLSPAASFSDLNLNALHAAASGIQFRGTAYHGRRAVSGDRRSDGAERLVQEGRPLLSSVAAHDWQTTTAALGVRALLSTRTFLEGSTRYSRYRYAHDYRLADPRGDLVFGPGVAEDAFGSQGNLNDSNRLDEWEVKARLDHAAGSHYLSVGLEGVSTISALGLRLADPEGGAVVGFAVPGQGAIPDTIRAFVPAYRSADQRESMGRAVLWASDRYQRGRLTAELGTRLTLLTARSTVYAEPRLRLGWQATPSLAAGLSGGLYRQYLLQFDYSTVNAGEVVPSTRIWLPVPEARRPPRALHLAADLVWQTDPARIRLEGYVKRVDGGLTPDYLGASGEPVGSGLLTVQRARHAGAFVQLERESSLGMSRASYRWARDRLTAPSLFGGKTLTAPWSVPHAATFSHAARWRTVGTALTLRWESGQRWALRQAYYDYFRTLPAHQGSDGWDLSDPDAHRLSDRWTVDLSGTWAPVPRVEVYGEVQNLTDRRNELDWRLLHDGTELVPTPRYLPGRAVLLGLRVSL